jgi:lipoprotein-releasing system ATP-binding protein
VIVGVLVRFRAPLQPSETLAPHQQRIYISFSLKLRDEFGQTFVIVTHNEELANMADRKLVMVDGLISN